MAALHTEDCIAVLVELRDHAEAEQVRLAAANALLDRGHGRPHQEVDVSTDKKVMVIVNYAQEQPALADHSTDEAETLDTL